MRMPVLLLAALGACAIGSAALAQQAPATAAAAPHLPANFRPQPDESLKVLQGVMVAMKWELAAIAAVVKGEQPYSEDTGRHAQMLAQQALMLPPAFVTPTLGLPNSQSQSAIWSKREQFDKALQSFQTETAQLAYIARTPGNENALKTQFKAVAESCKGCHDTFRKDRG